MTLSLRVECSPPGLHSILAKATNIGYLFFAKLKVLSSLTKTEIKRPPIYKKWMERAAGLFLSALIAVLLTMLFLAVFAFAMLKGNLSASVEKIGLIVMSVMACFVGGFLCGKKNIKKRYLWGLGVGVLYCLFFGVIRVGMGQAFVTDTTAFFTMMLYCAAGGMLGGMLS